MKLPCAIVQDLLPVYEEELCSPESREAVREHLAQCPQCGRSVRPIHIPAPEPEKQEKAVVRSFRKVRRRWIASILLVLILLPILGGVGYLGWNQYQGEGICFTNLDEISKASDFVKLLEKGQYEKAAKCLDYSTDYESIQDALSLTWQDNLPNVQPVQVGGSAWMAEPELVGQYLGDTSEQALYGLIYNGADRVLIPTNVFKSALKAGADEGRWDDTIYETGNGYIYASFQTQWGSFMVEQNSWSQIMEHSDDAAMLCYHFAMYPQWLYDQSLPELEDYAKAQWQSTQDWNDPYRDMTLEEYTACRIQEFAQEMRSLEAQGVSIQHEGFEDAYQIDGEWVIRMDVTVSKGNKKIQMILDVRMSNEKMKINGGHHTPDAPYWIDQLWDVLI